MTEMHISVSLMVGSGKYISSATVQHAFLWNYKKYKKL